jgi:ribosomal protein S2
LQSFLKFCPPNKINVCFVSFNPTYSSLAKQLAMVTNQSYIEGYWVNGFFSKGMPDKLYGFFHNNYFGSYIKKTVLSLLVFITLDKAELFLSESNSLNLPSVCFIDNSTVISDFTYPILCEILSLDIIFFYSHILTFFLKHYRCIPKNIDD